MDEFLKEFFNAPWIYFNTFNLCIYYPFRHLVKGKVKNKLKTEITVKFQDTFTTIKIFSTLYVEFTFQLRNKGIANE